MRLFAIYIFFLFNLSFIYGQNIVRTGTPLVQQFTKNSYNAGNQNWSVTVGEDGIIYVGNTEGLLSYDGQYWKLHPLKNRSTIRSVKASTDGRIYSGGYREFGFWERKKNGRLVYNSISAHLEDKKQLLNDEIWKIILQDDKIYFHAFSKCYVYHGENKPIQVIKANGEPFLFPHQVDDRIYFEQLPSGLHLLQNTALIPVKDKDKLKDKHILCILPFDSTRYLLGTARHGLYLLDKEGNIASWSIEASSKLVNAQINNGIYLYGDQYAFGTIKDGVIILNKKGEIVQHINKNNGLQNNTVLSVTKDKQNNIWVGLDNGIDRIEINSPLYFYSDFSGNIGTVYTSIIYKDKIYLGTNQGLFSSAWKNLETYNSFDFNLVPNSSGQVWSLNIVNDQLICGHNDGTFVVNADGLSKISAVTGGWLLKAVPNTSYLLQGNYTGIAKFDGDPTFRFIKKFSKINEPIRGIIHKSQNEYWVSDGNKVSLIGFDDSFDKLHFITTSTGDSTSRDIQFYGAFHLENNIVFTTDTGLFYYDDIVKKFRTHTELNARLGTFSLSNKIIRKEDAQYWFINRSRIAMVTFHNDGNIDIDSTSMNPLRNKMMNFYENIIPIYPGFYIIGLDNGFSIYNDNKTKHKTTIPPPIISQIWNIHRGSRAIEEENIVIPYDENSIRIAFASPYYTTSPLSYQYQLEGYAENWSLWDNVAYKDFTNLPHGKYTFNIRARSADGQESAVAQFHFTVQTPWYLSWWAIIIYLLVAVGIALWIIKRYISYQQRKQFQLRRRLLEQQQEAIARKNEINEQKLILLKNKQLEKELEIKNRELANAATNIIYKNEMLNNLHAELRELKDAEGNQLSQDELRKINKLIEDAHNDDRDWDIFEKSFNEAHGNFFKKLKAEYPDLVPNDLKLCAYLRLNMSSKEIASLLNISTRGVEIRRYRLRKKLGIPTDKNLTEFLLER